MAKVLTFLLLLVVATLTAGLYGALHDQLTYTLAPEYYTKFKFYQFGFVDQGDEAILPNPRAAAAIVGFLATWWFGLDIGAVLGLVGLAQPTATAMRRITLRAIGVALGVAAATGLVGLAYGKLVLAHRPRAAFAGWFLPDNLVDLPAFVAVGSMHNFSYLGGLLGLVAGVAYSLWQLRRARRLTT